MESLSTAQARRIALVAQGFRDPRHTTPTMRTLSRTLARTGVLQVDSVNVLRRAHYMPLFSRMGPYDDALLRRASERKPRRVIEFWAHVQAFMPVELWPVMQHRMDRYRTNPRWGDWQRSNPQLVARMLEEVQTAWRVDGPPARRRRPARQDELGLELVGGAQGARLPLPGRRPRDRVPQLGVRVRLRPARAGAAAARADDAHARTGRRPPRAGPPRRDVARGRHRAVPARLLPDGGRRGEAGDPVTGRRR